MKNQKKERHGRPWKGEEYVEYGYQIPLKINDNIINILFFKHLIAILIILRVPYSVGFLNTTHNVIKSQINKRNIIVYFILFLFLLVLGVGFREPTPKLRKPNTTSK